MKNALIFCCSLLFLAVNSCSDGNVNTEETSLQDKEPCLEDILELQSEAALTEKYGKGSITYDTIWGAEGYFTMGTYVRTDEFSHVEIFWSDSAARTGMISATLVSDADYYADKLESGKWKSCTGVFLGMSTDELQKLNGRPFKFSGFGWDYGGGVIGWDGGTLEGKGISVQLSEGSDAELSEEETLQILGDITVMSNNPVLQKNMPRVWSISVAKVK